ncbi:MAG: flagellar biosynthetic protein FliO [Candidatus Thiodiazotropha taylori]|nr:flagellar biosynthetic protein FliO [Candidatus Thiodiazotropha taylori]
MENYAQELLYTLMALIFVIALAWIFLKALKGLHTKQGGADRINLLLNLPVGSRERVVVVTYRQHEYLVGITTGGMSLLDKLPIVEPLASGNQDVPEG